MNVDMIILIVLAIIYSGGMFFLLKRQWNILNKNEQTNTSSWMKWYTSAILISNIMIIYFNYFFYSDDIFTTLRNMTIVSLLWVAAAIDKKYYLIPNRLTIIGLMLWAGITIAEIVTKQSVWLNNLILEGIAVVCLLIIVGICLLVMKNSIGMGDLKILIVMALFLKLNGFLSAVFLSLIVSFIASVFLLIKKIKDRKDTIPFGPFLLAGTLIGIIITGL